MNRRGGSTKDDAAISDVGRLTASTTSALIRKVWQVCFVAAFAWLAVSPLAANDPAQPQFVQAWGQAGDKPGEFHSPIGIARTVQNEYFVTDLNNARVQRFSADGKFLSEFPLPRDAADRKSTIIGGILVVDELVFVSFMVQHKIAAYRPTGELIREWGKKGEGLGEFHQPGGMILARDGHLVICDQCNHRIVKYTREGKFVDQWGGYGVERGQFGAESPKASRFGGPHFVAQDRREHFYTTEGIAGRVQQFDKMGGWLAAWGDKGDQPGGFGAYKFNNMPHTMGPIAIAIDPHDRIFVSSLNDRVQCFDVNGKFLFGIRHAGQPDDLLVHPHGMTFDADGHLFLCDSGNQRIVKYKLPRTSAD